jgi:hypothetical protein
LQNRASIAAMIRPVHAHMQENLASSHARRLAAGEYELERLLEIALR